MATVSLQYFLFVALTFLLMWVSKGKGRNWILLGCNIAFLVSFGQPIHGLWVFGVILYTFVVAQNVRKVSKVLFAGMLIPYVFALAFFKYFDFLNWVMPLGLSFYTFKAIAYLVECRKKTTKRASLFNLALYLSFFPVFTAGPINRPASFFEQLKQPATFDYLVQKNGAVQCAFGLFEKVVFADALSATVNTIFSDTSLGGWYVLLGIVLYSFQIYTDFDGYSNIALGISKMLGFSLEPNFRTPYLAANIKQFWNRWHISLSSWLKDYIYIPLGGSRKGKLRKALNVLAVFLVSGMWHGNTWVFVLWGLGHGLLNVIEDLFSVKKESQGLQRILGIVLNFTLVSILWVFFRSASLNEAFSIFGRLFAFSGFAWETLGMTLREGIWTLMIVGLIIITDILRNQRDMVTWLSQRPWALRWTLYIVTLAIFLVFGAYGPGYHAQDFIYVTF